MPKNSQYSVTVSEGRKKAFEYSNKDKLQEALKKFNAKPNIDREGSLNDASEDVEIVSKVQDKGNKLEELKITSTFVPQIVESSETTTKATSELPTPTTTVSSSTTGKIGPNLKLDSFLDPLETSEEIVLDGRDGSNDNFLFGPQTRPPPASSSSQTPRPTASPRPVTSTRSSLVFSTAKPDLGPDDPVNDIVLGSHKTFSSSADLASCHKIKLLCSTQLYIYYFQETLRLC